MKNNWEKVIRLSEAEIINIDFSKKRKTNPDGSISPSTSDYKDSVGKIFQSEPKQQCNNCGFNTFFVHRSDCIRCLKCFKQQDQFTPKFVDVTPHVEMNSEAASEQGIHPSLLSRMCKDCGLIKSTPQEECDHKSQTSCNECGAILRYLLQTTGQMNHPELTQHHAKFHMDPKTGKF